MMLFILKLITPDKHDDKVTTRFYFPSRIRDTYLMMITLSVGNFNVREIIRYFVRRYMHLFAFLKYARIVSITLASSIRLF